MALFWLLAEGVVFCRIFDVRVDEERVRLAMDILNGNLKAVEASSFWRRDFRREIATEVFIDNTIRGGKKSKDMWNEMLFGWRKLFPVNYIGR